MMHDRRHLSLPVMAVSGLAGLILTGLGPVAMAQSQSQSQTVAPSGQEASPAVVNIGAPWVWTLYADGNPVVLAQEIPDTPQLKTTLECEPGSKRVQLSLYGVAHLGDGAAILRSGQQSAPADLQTRRARLTATVPVDHPVFVAFQASGELQITREAQSSTVSIGAQHMPLLHRFVRACSG